MPRATSGLNHHKKQKKVLKEAKGFRGSRSTLYRTAKDSVRRAQQNSFDHRRKRQGDFRKLWISRINAAAVDCGMSYSQFMAALKKADISLNRKMLAEIAVTDFDAFKKIVDEAKAA